MKSASLGTVPSSLKTISDVIILPEVSNAANILCCLTYWSSEASPTLGCSIEISRDIVCQNP